MPLSVIRYIVHLRRHETLGDHISRDCAHSLIDILSDQNSIIILKELRGDFDIPQWRQSVTPSYLRLLVCMVFVPDVFNLLNCVTRF